MHQWEWEETGTIGRNKTMSKSETGSSSSPKQTLDESTEQVVDAESVGEETEELELDHIFEILKNERRRKVVHYLREHESRVTLNDLAEHIAALENDTDVASITSRERKRVYVGLYQCHLPKMADMGIVNFNQDRGIITLGPAAPKLYQYLDAESSDSRDWYKYYLGIAGLGAVLFGATTLLSVSVLASTAVLAATVLGFVGCALYHTVAESDREET
jgi:DNA-binding transcriptional ArsR family regulator